MIPGPESERSIGLLGATSIGAGAIVGGGILALYSDELCGTLDGVSSVRWDVDLRQESPFLFRLSTLSVLTLASAFRPALSRSAASPTQNRVYPGPDDVTPYRQIRQDELDRRFHLPFEMMTNDALESARTGRC